MSKRTYQEIRKKILKVLSDGKTHSFGNLERRVNTNWLTIRNHCKDLEVFKAVILSDEGIKITKEGQEVLKRL